jgi:hypothetical protein
LRSNKRKTSYFFNKSEKNKIEIVIYNKFNVKKG